LEVSAVLKAGAGLQDATFPHNFDIPEENFSDTIPDIILLFLQTVRITVDREKGDIQRTEWGIHNECRK